MGEPGTGTWDNSFMSDPHRLRKALGSQVGEAVPPILWLASTDTNRNGDYDLGICIQLLRGLPRQCPTASPLFHSWVPQDLKDSGEPNGGCSMPLFHNFPLQGSIRLWGARHQRLHPSIQHLAFSGQDRPGKHCREFCTHLLQV